MNIGANIKQLRQRMNLTQEQVANKLGVSYQAVSKWEVGANTPDISLLPEIASLFGVTIDSLFSDNIDEFAEAISLAKDDDVIRVVQMRGKKVIGAAVSSVSSQDAPSIEIAFPKNCNDRTQYFKVEVYGSVISDGSINGDVVCYQNIECSQINGDIKSYGDINASGINCGKIICGSISDCYKLEAKSIDCSGSVNSANLTCGQITYMK